MRQPATADTGARVGEMPGGGGVEVGRVVAREGEYGGGEETVLGSPAFDTVNHEDGGEDTPAMRVLRSWACSGS